MCTVTYIPLGNSKFIFTSNRDEAPNRKTLFPEVYTVNNTRVLFPKDELAGGTWIGLSEKNRLLCLLNGGFTLHERKAEYRMSRGIVVKDILTCSDAFTSLENYNLENIEPFTLIVIDWSSEFVFIELVWDGQQKHLRQLPNQPILWSSSTLFSEPMKRERQNWFKSYLETNDLSQDSISKFHKTAGENNLQYGIIMDRGFVKTTSITQIEKLNAQVKMHFEDLQLNQNVTKVIPISEAVND